MALFRFPVDLVYGVAGGPGVNVWNVRTTEAAPSTGQLAGLSSMIEQFYTTIANLFPGTMTMSYAGVATTIDQQPPVNDSSAPSWSVQGTASNDYLPVAAMIQVRFSTTRGGRSGRGSKYLGPLSVDIHQTDGTPAASYLTEVRNAADALIASSKGFDNGAVVIYSHKLKLGFDIEGESVKDKFAVLTSRRD